jgi:hypothetical protein
MHTGFPWYQGKWDMPMNLKSNAPNLINVEKKQKKTIIYTPGLDPRVLFQIKP